MQDLSITTIHKQGPFDDASFQFDPSSFEVTKRLETFSGKENFFTDRIPAKEKIPVKSPKQNKYLVEQDDELLTFSAFNENTLEFIFDDGDTTLIIKEHIIDSRHSASDAHLIKLDGLSSKLLKFNSMQTEKPLSLWNKVYNNISGAFIQTRKTPKHLRITKVIVNLNDCEGVSDKGIGSLVNFLKNFKSLQKLEFEVKNTDASDESVGFVSSLLTALTSLKCLYIDFSGCRISDEGIFVLANALKIKKDMKEIWLRFSWCQSCRITNDAILALSKSLDTFTNLEILLLEFNGHTEITSKGPSAVLNSIKRLQSLKKLFLYFERAQVSDNFLAYAGGILPKLKGLKVFGLNLANSAYITPKGIDKLEKALGSLNGLKTGLYIYLNGCLGFRENEVVRQSLENLVKKKKVKNHVLEFE